MIAEWMIAVGLAFDLAGALALAADILNMSNRDILESGTMQLGDEENAENNRSLSSVQRLFSQRNYAKTGIILLAFGFLLQFVAALRKVI
jgi:hypothetical protein